MSIDRSGSRPTRAPFVLLVTALGLVALLLVVQAPAAAAHAQLESSNPVDGSRVTTLPTNAEFVFNEDINPSYAQLVVKDSFATKALDPVSVRGPSVSAPLPRGLASGPVELSYRVVSADGHPISGTITVTYAPPAAASASPSASAPVTGPSSTAPAPAATTAPAAAQSSNDGNAVMLALGGLGALVLVAVIALLLRADRRRRAS